MQKIIMEDEKDVVTTTEDNSPDVNEPEIQDVKDKAEKSNKRSLRAALIESNRRVAELEAKTNENKSAIPSSIMDVITELSDSPETANRLAQAIKELSNREMEQFLSERENMSSKKQRDEQLRELEAEQVIDETLDQYEARGIKITQKEVQKKLIEEYGDEDGELVEVDSRAIKTVIKLLALEKQSEFKTEADKRKKDIEKITTTSNNSNNTETRIYDPIRRKFVIK